MVLILVGINTASHAETIALDRIKVHKYAQDHCAKADYNHLNYICWDSGNPSCVENNPVDIYKKNKRG
jgi:hypothetical protein